MRDQYRYVQPLLLLSERAGLLNEEFIYQYSLSRLHQICEANYLLLSSFTFSLDKAFRQPLPDNGSLQIILLEQARYTSTLEWCMKTPVSRQWTLDFKATIRLYHDVKMAEVISMNTSSETINACDLYKDPNEKFHLNCLFYEWLEYCLR